MSPGARFARIAAAALIAVATLGPVATAAPSAKRPWNRAMPRVKPGRVVVTFEARTSAAERRAIHATAGARLAPHGRANGIDVVELPPGVGVAAAIRRYAADPRVVSAEADRYATLAEVPNDEFFGSQWGLHNTHQSHSTTDTEGGPPGASVGTADADVDAPAAWDATTTGDDVVVAVIDLGVDVDHPDLAASMWTNQVEATGTPGVDDDGNGYLDDVHGWDFKQDDADPSPGSGGFAWHGTHVAGIVAAERGNATGIAGVCGACRIMALRFDLSLGQELEAIEYAAANGADVINMSFGSPIWSNAERTAIEAAGDAGVLTVVSAGNSSLDNDTATFIGFSSAPDFPASYTLPTILSVAASNDKDQYAYGSECDQRAGPRWLCAFTSWGHDSVDVAAPGVDIMSTVPPPLGQFDEGYLFSDGTSMAAPLVAGIAGLVQHHNPSYGPLALKNAVMRSVDRPRALRMLSSWAEQIGVGKRPIEGRFTRTQGRVNALEALTAPTTNATPLTDGNIDGAKAMRATVRGRVVWPADVNDVYRKRLGGRNRYRVMLNGPPGKDLDLLVWIPDATEIHQFTRSCFQRRGVCPFLKAYPAEFDADEQVTFRVANTGVFFIQVQGWYSSGSYTLSVRRL